MIPFGEYRPDVADYRGETSQTITNVIPHGDGYAPIGALAASYNALASTCSGFFTAYKADGTKVMFAGTPTKLYSATTGAWTDRSKGGGSYTTLSSGEYWQFAQFNNFVFAVQGNTAPQVYDLTSSTAFADLGGSPPNAKYITIVNRFVVLGGLASPNGNRIQWSGLNATTTWTSGVTLSDFQDLPDCGLVRGLAGGESGYIFQDRGVRRMTFAPGSPYVFGIDVISRDDGLMAPYSLHQSGDRILYYSPQGFKMLLPGGYPKAIGKERVDRTVNAAFSTVSMISRVLGSADPGHTRSCFAINVNNSPNTPYDTLYFYDWALDRWTKASVNCEFVHNGIPANPAGDPREVLLAANTSHTIGSFSGNKLEATLITAEQTDDTRKLYVNGFRPVTDASSVYGSVYYRERVTDSVTQTTEQPMDSNGFVPQHISSRLVRGVVRIPAATSWTFCAGIEPDANTDGKQ